MTIETQPTVAGLALRTAALDDAAFVADMFTALWPDEPEDPVMTRHFWEHPWDEGKWERWIGAQNGKSVAFVAYGHAPWEVMPERYARLQGDLLPVLSTPDRLGALIDFAEERAKADGALRVTKWAREHDALQIGVLGTRGFKETRRERFWELDLKANREKLAKMADASRARMREQGITILTLA
ncbi:MAG: hypothetical protein HYX56_04165, partial [Chloroflexi bacterium]|nr:hypothetical protein [Chloroflexota bacterium]